jgi:hypothetical protein
MPPDKPITREEHIIFALRRVSANLKRIRLSLRVNHRSVEANFKRFARRFFYLTVNDFGVENSKEEK